MTPERSGAYFRLDGNGGHQRVLAGSGRVSFTGPRLLEPTLHCTCVSLPVSDGAGIGTCIRQDLPYIRSKRNLSEQGLEIGDFVSLI